MAEGAGALPGGDNARRGAVAACALALLGGVLAPGASAAVTSAEPRYEVIREQNVVIPMTDGTRLVGDVYRPKPAAGQPADQRFPCLYEVTPYRKEMRAAEAANFFPARGFVYIEVDARGTGGSEGEYDGVFLKQEQLDGYDGIEWLATQYPHCNGKVGMWGGSYSGINQYLIATSPKGRPPHLRTIAPQRALSDLYRDIVYTGGILTGSFGLIWAGGTTGYNAVGADPTTRPSPELAANALVEHLRNDPMFLTYLNAPFDGPLYRDSSVIYRLSQLDIPVFHQVGLYDAFTRGQLQAVGRLLELEKRGEIPGPHYAVVGPWNHGDTHFLTQPPYDARILDWYRHWLDDLPRPSWFAEDRVSYCVMLEARNGRCEWKKSPTWPPPRTATSPYYLAPGGALSAAPPSGSGPVGSWTYDPTAGQGENAFSKWDNAAGPPQRDADQASEDERKGLVFTTPELTRDLEIAGPINLSLRASTEPLTGPAASVSFADGARILGLAGAAQALPPYHDTDFVVKLTDVDPSGRSTLIQSGFLRASHRLLDESRTRRSGSNVVEPVPFHEEAKLAPPDPGKTYTYEIEVWPTAKRFAAGHRLRITLYSADTANHLTLVKPAVNTVYSGSYLSLPVAGGGSLADRTCRRPSTLRFKLHRVEGTRVVRVQAYVDGKRRLNRRGRDIRRIALTRMKRTGKLRVRIVATHNTGSKVVSTRSWDGCKKTRPSVRLIPRPRR
jgi:putative CocE/NonD family hydrolase